jgi:hypothetical protein
MFGGGDDSLLLFPILSNIKEKLDGINVPTYGTDLTQIVVLLCFSGEVYSYNETKVGKTRFELKRKRASVEHYFAPIICPESKAAIETAIINSLRALSKAGPNKDISFDWTGLINEVKRVIA